MSKSIVISERDNIAAVIENGKVSEFFIHRGDILLGDVYLASVENILPSIDAAFVHVGSDKMGFLHASDVIGKGALQDKLKPKQKLLVQVVKEPTGHKGPRVTTSLSLPGRFLVLMPDEKGVSISRKIASAKERARLKSIVSLLKPAGLGVIIRTEAEGQSESEIQEDLELLLEKWNTIVATADTVEPPSLVSRDQDLLYRVIREACNDNVDEIIVDTSFALHRANQLLQSWNMNQKTTVNVHKGMDPILVAKGIDKEIRQALNTKVFLPSGGYLFIQQTEALAVIDVNSGKFTSSATQGETIRKTNLEALSEIARQLRLRNIGGMIIIDFIDMDNRVDKLAILEELEVALEPDKSKPQIGQLSDLGLVELTRHRQGQSLSEISTKRCPACSGSGQIIEGLNFASSPHETEYKAKSSKIKPQHQQPHQQKKPMHGNGNRPQQQQQNRPQQQERRIPTSPSIVAASQQKTEEEKQSFTLNNDVVKEFVETKGLYLPISDTVRYGTVPPGIAEKKFPQSYNKDVFMILDQLEGTEEVKTEKPQEQPQRPQQQVRHQHARPQGVRHHHVRQQPQEQRPQDQRPQEQRVQEQRPQEQRIEEQKPFIEPQIKPEVVEVQVQEETKKLQKRGRRPSTGTKTSTRKTPARKPKTETPEVPSVE